MTVEELAMTDFFFQPHFNKPWSLLNAIALEALQNKNGQDKNPSHFLL